MSDEIIRDSFGHMKAIFLFVYINIVIFIAVLTLLFPMSASVNASPSNDKNIMTVSGGVSSSDKLVMYETNCADYFNSGDVLKKRLLFHRSTLLKLHGIPATLHISTPSPSLVAEPVVIQNNKYQELNQYGTPLLKTINHIND